jgi:hypothetical protein
MQWSSKEQKKERDQIVAEEGFSESNNSETEDMPIIEMPPLPLPANNGSTSSPS